MQYTCQNLNCDLITYNSDTIKLKVYRTHYLQAVSRNIYFEIKYSPCILDSNERVATIFKGETFREIAKAKNIIISSGAKDSFHIRGPYAVSNLGWIFGLSTEQSKESIRGKCHKLLYRAETRRHGSAMVFVRKLKKLGIQDEDDISDSDDDEEKPTYTDVDNLPINIDDIEFSSDIEEAPKKKQKVK